jgi:hypothetical protein
MCDVTGTIRDVDEQYTTVSTTFDGTFVGVSTDIGTNTYDIAAARELAIAINMAADQAEAEEKRRESAYADMEG